MLRRLFLTALVVSTAGLWTGLSAEAGCFRRHRCYRSDCPAYACPRPCALEYAPYRYDANEYRTTRRIICRDQPVPPGYVIVGTAEKAGCTVSSPNAYTLAELPTEGQMTICANQSIPPGWREVGTTRSAACPGDGQNARIIVKP
ncbi:MAG: hypothetical protein KF774_15475 [Planctomyces sp.]|nr:hypothetical protein [Planctomyces sp.]